MAVKRPEWDTVRLVLLAIITFMWVTNWVVALFNDTYKPDPTVNAVFTLAAGVVFATKSGKKSDGGNGE